ncbi:MAG TPA: type II toxin-antitoxin system VapC family toxin [Rubrobacteraceae bacterium]|nr:type II toxin-antitoxin system VapC family toxin [Rubrobacteraceae bacterium]
MDAVDTNVLVRYFLQDDPEKGPAAARLIDGTRELGISLVALAETAFVLSRNYGVPREQVVDRLVKLLRKRNIDLLGIDKALVASALLLCRPSGRINYADALINADARAHAVDRLYTFDERFPPEGLALRQPS